MRETRSLQWAAFVLVLVGAAVLIAGRGRYAGSISGSQAIPGTRLLLCSVFQFDKYEGEYSESKRRPLFAILWKASQAGSSSLDGRNMLTSIHDHAISPSRSKKAVYALQPDYSLKPLSLTEQEIDHLFSLNVMQAIDENAPSLMSDAVWKEKIEPNLQVVEPPPKT